MSSIDDLGSAAGLSEQDRELLALLLAEEGILLLGDGLTGCSSPLSTS